MFLILAAMGIAFVLGLDWIRKKWAMRKARRYLRSLSRVDDLSFCAAYPNYDKEFLIKFRITVANYFDTEPLFITPELSLLPSSPLAPFQYFLYIALVDTFCPSSKRQEPLQFPKRDIVTLEELISETNLLANW